MKDSFSKFAPLPVRIIIGIGFVYHGFPKLFSSEGHTMFLGMLQQIGVPAAELMSWSVGVLEFLGGLALIAGVLVKITSVLLGIDMLVAIFTVHLPNGFSFMNITAMTENGPQFGMPGYEVPLLYIAGLFALVIAGAGPFSFDSIRAAKRG